MLIIWGIQIFNENCSGAAKLARCVEVLRNPKEVRKGKYGRNIALKAANDKLIRVVYIEKGKRDMVLTAYKTDPERYGVK